MNKPSSSSTKSNRAAKEEEEEEAMLMDEFQTVPYEAIPNYNDFVRKAVAMETLRTNLNLHVYRSMSELTRDF